MSIISLDLDPILEGFDHIPGEIVTRIVVGEDGRQKVQMRTELGVIQLHADGPPDGREHGGYPSLLDYHRARLRDGCPGRSGKLYLSGEECRELFDEATVYYLRYICCLQLKDYARAERDTVRNLAVMDFCGEHAASDEDREALEQYRPFVLMMRARAQAGRLVEENDSAGAADSIAEAIVGIRELISGRGPDGPYADASDDMDALEALAEELRSHGGEMVDRVRLQLEMRRAVDREDYRRAAQLRDALKKLE